MPFAQYNLLKLNTLQPALQPIAIAFLEQCAAAGIPVDIVQGTRTFAEQQAVYDQGRTAPGVVVTKAKPGDSYHQYGLAFDVVPTAYKSLPDWNPGGPLWDRIGAIGKTLGLNWGGDFSSRDRPHFELHAAPLAELKEYWNKFQQIMPITITPTTGGFALIALIVAVYYFFLRPQLEQTRLI